MFVKSIRGEQYAIPYKMQKSHLLRFYKRYYNINSDSETFSSVNDNFSIDSRTFSSVNNNFSIDSRTFSFVYDDISFD